MKTQATIKEPAGYDLAGITNLSELLAARVKASPQNDAYHSCKIGSEDWHAHQWQDIAKLVEQWRNAMHADGVAQKTRVAMMLPNGVDWIVCDQAILSLGAVSVPIFSHDSAGNVAHILHDSGAEFLVTDSTRLRTVLAAENLPPLKRIVVVGDVEGDAPNAVSLESWLREDLPAAPSCSIAAEDVATLVYTSGTTGSPKGVILSHRNILANVHTVLHFFPLKSDNLFLSFLPLSHIFERTVGYYASMYIGAQTVFARSVQQLKQDMAQHKPTVLLAVPKVYSAIYDKVAEGIAQAPGLIQKLFRTISQEQDTSSFSYRLAKFVLGPLVGAKLRAVFGGRVRYAISGGAALPAHIDRTLNALGVPLYQGYGLTETSPVVAANQETDNVPGSIGFPLPGVEVKIGEENELLTRSDCVMQGYWQRADATAEAIDSEGWFHTGDQARFDEDGRLYIIGRIKDIIVMSNGEKIPPVDMESAISEDNSFDQVMVYGNNRHYLSVLVVLNPDALSKDLERLGFADEKTALTDKQYQKELLKKVQARLTDFPAYAKIRRIIPTAEAWTLDNGLLTPTFKVKRQNVEAYFAEAIEEVYRSL